MKLTIAQSTFLTSLLGGPTAVNAHHTVIKWAGKNGLIGTILDASGTAHHSITAAGYAALGKTPPGLTLTKPARKAKKATSYGDAGSGKTAGKLLTNMQVQVLKALTEQEAANGHDFGLWEEVVRTGVDDLTKFQLGAIFSTLVERKDIFETVERITVNGNDHRGKKYRQYVLTSTARALGLELLG